MSRYKDVILTMLLMLLLSAAAHAGPLEQYVDTYAGHLEDFITPAGTFDLNQVKAIGFQGALDMRGVQIELDAATGALVFSQPQSQPQANAGERITIPPNDIAGPVWAMCVYDGNLIVGGDFSGIESIQPKHIAMYDGTTWHALGRFGLDAPVRSIIVKDGKLIVGGDFKTAGNNVVNKVAAWDGQYWSRVGRGMYKSVCQLGTVGDMLVGSGDFHSDRAGCQMCYVVAFSGHDWSVVNMQQLSEDALPASRTITASLASK